ncbi:hypothetical protein CSV86_009425 [Pseudomonas putida CSV86]|uniref:Putative tail fiber protein gp53-like C-terminal domain-containing protein n=1 Tax=Pseudomonas bharatica CSV86 TaxID=1005395 RepID=A0A7K4ECQ6_9PSED|nr:hypothetical protein [Pseudomonas bharatica]NNJ15436.1 hypothetical protein [Pseudomonas bharatica CSV86]
MPFALLRDLPATLSEHGISAATQADAETGADNVKPMTALRVSQAINKLVRQASESVSGLMKLANQDQTNAGADDSVAITPKKLRFGFQALFDRNGFIVFPRWLGGLTLQWGVTPTYLVNTIGTLTTRITYPIQFPTGAFTVFVVHEGTTSALSSAALANGFDESGFVVSLENTRNDQSVAGRWIAIGS